ncbi:MAG: ester cyclase [Hyphomicrobiales bacterium]|nr:ester cyclase [Hyphomicrobiales bacterium]MCP4997767.1 ester cyclase [Hyphomicrobiales bacterium]
MTEHNKAVLERVIYEVFNKNRLDLIPELYTEDVGGFDTATQQELSGHDIIRNLVAGYRATFPDHQYVLHDLVGEGDKVCARWSVTDRTIFPDFSVEGLSLCQFRDGKICRVWQQWDDLGLLQQLDAVSKSVNIASAVLNRPEG